MAETPQSIAGYRVVRQIGKGAASVIYEVTDPRSRHFALKQTPKRTERDQRYVDQTLNEHQVASKLDSPLLRKSYKLIKRGFLRTTEVLLLMELVEGTPLENDCPADLKTLVAIFDRVAAGLSVMHKAGYAHADINPSNILRTPKEGIKLIDFGHSCPIGTVKKRMQGTIKYIAPEQVARGPITPYTDAYNLGATMYACMTGETVPPPPGLLKGSSGITGPLRDPRELRPETPPVLSALLLECLRQQPGERPRSMELVRERLRIAYQQIEPPSPQTAP